MYWNEKCKKCSFFSYVLNSNIRCIEIHFWVVPLWPPIWLNSNIRCIEIKHKNKQGVFLYMLNSNIRCIEIGNTVHVQDLSGCWIVTLDVLKLRRINYDTVTLFSWIVTLDVLKFSNEQLSFVWESSWIVTLDVLK